MATKIKAHNLHTDVKAILDSKATATQLAAKADISALAGKADSDTVVAALANKLTAVEEYTFFGLKSRVAESVMFDESIWFSGPYEYFDQQVSHGIKDSDFDLIFYTMGDFATGRGGDVRFTHPAAGYGMTGKTHLLIDKNDDFAVVTSGPIRLEDSRSITLGADSDFTITHDGTNNIINSVGSGDLFIQDAGVNKLALNDTGIIVYGTIQSATSGTPTITSASNIIFNADGGNGIINFSGSKIINLGNPVDSQDAAPKSYVDSVNYKDSDVNTHLNTDSATAGEVLSWNGTDYNWTAQSGGGAVSGDITVNTLQVDSDIKLTPDVSIKTISPSYTGTSPYTGQEVTLPETTWFEKKIFNLGAHGMLFFMGFPLPVYSNTTLLMSAEITIHAVTYDINATLDGYDSDFADSQIIQGYLMHNHTTTTFTETSNTCTDSGVNLITLSTYVNNNSSNPIGLSWTLAQEKYTRITVNSRSAMTQVPA